jgi:hypothetical protein
MASRLKLLSCRSIDGYILSDKADILKRWKVYFQNLYDMREDKSKMPPQWTVPSTVIIIYFIHSCRELELDMSNNNNFTSKIT